MSVQNYTQTTRRAPFLEAAQESYINLLTKGVGRAPGSAGVPTLAQLGPTVAPVDPLTQAAQQQAAAQAGLGHKLFNSLCRPINNKLWMQHYKTLIFKHKKD